MKIILVTIASKKIKYLKIYLTKKCKTYTKNYKNIAEGIKDLYKWREIPRHELTQYC